MKKYLRLVFPNRMANDLRAEKVGKKEFLFYVLFFIVGCLSTIPYLLGMWDEISTYTSNSVMIADKVFLTVVFLASFFIAHYANRAGDGKRFWYRFVSLDFPLVIVALFVTVVLGFFAGIFGIVSAEYFGYPDLIIEIIVHTLYLCLLWKYMRVISSVN